MRILIIAPDTPGLAIQPLISYLKSQNSPHQTDVILHPVAPGPRRRISQLRGKRIRRESKHLSAISYLGDAALTLSSSLFGRSYDWAICLSPHLAYTGLLLRDLGKVKRIVYWALDYYPKRYGKEGKVGGGRLGNMIEGVYKRLEKAVVKSVDLRWGATWAMKEGWIEGEYTWKGEYRRVPNTISERREPVPFEKRMRKVIWSGALNPSENPTIGLLESALTLGDGKMGVTVTTRTRPVEELGRFLLRTDVDYRGFVADPLELEELVSTHLAGLALYAFGGNSFKKYSDASRVKMYDSIGVHIICSGIPELGAEVEECEAGRAIANDVEELRGALDLVSSKSANKKMAEGAFELAGRYLAKPVFDREMKFLEESL